MKLSQIDFEGYPSRTSSVIFFSGLRDEIRLPVIMFKPNNLIIAYNLAKIQEEHFGVTKRNYKGILPFPESFKTPICESHHSPKRTFKSLGPTTKDKPEPNKRLERKMTLLLL